MNVRNHDPILYILKEIDWFGIKDKLIFLLLVGKLHFYHSFLTIIIGKNLNPPMYSITSKLVHNMSRWKF